MLMMDLPATLSEAQIFALPTAAYYIPNFVTEAEEKLLLEKIATAPKPRWKQLSARRLQTWPSELTSKNVLIDQPLPSWLQEPVASRITSIRLNHETENQHIFSDSPHKAPNHVLINEYLPGQGIMPHKDGPAYYPVVCTVSLGASLCLEIYKTKEDGTREEFPFSKILQEPRSLLVTTGDLYTEHMHGIADVPEDINLGPDTVANWTMLHSASEFSEGCYERETRTSLTYRDVLKVSKLGSKFGFIKR